MAAMTRSVAAVPATRALPAVLAILFGVFLYAGVGFAAMPEIHNATHDARHALGFPCH